MSANASSDDPNDGPSPFASTWRRDGVEAASVRVSGEVDMATSPQLEETLGEALEHARLVVLNVREVSFMDSSGLRVLLNASRFAREAGVRLVVVGVSAQIDALLETTKTRAHVEVIPLPAGGEQLHDDTGAAPLGQDDGVIQPLDNPANAGVLTARAIMVSGNELWLEASDGAVRRAWAPQVAGLRVPAGAPVEVYLDDRGEVNGWREPRSGLAVNQRRLEPDSFPARAVAVTCEGPCGIVWQAPSASELREHRERCLTCSGPLAAG